MENLSKKQIIIIGIIVIIIAIVVVYYFFNKLQNINYEYLDDVDVEETEANNTEENIIKETEIIVHIAGAVRQEGIVELEEGARIVDAINKAGGLKEDADLTNVNLAYMLSDGQKIYIPHVGEEAEIKSESGENIILNSTDENPNNTSLININTATAAQLTELPRNRKFNSTKNSRL